MSPRRTPLTCCLLAEGQAATSPVGGALPGFPSQVSRERVAWATGGQAGGLGPPDPRFAAPGLGCQATPPDRSWLHLGRAHIPLDKSQCHLPSSCPSSWDAICPWVLPPSEAAPQAPSSVSLRLCPSLCTRRQSGPGVTHPSRLSWPTVPSFSPGSACLPACLPGPPLPCSPTRGPLPRMPPPETGCPRGARNCSLQGARHPIHRHTGYHTRAPSPSRPRRPSPLHLCLCLQQVPKHWGGRQVQAGRWRPATPAAASEKSAESGAESREGGRESRRKCGEEGVSEVEARKQPAQAAGGGEGRPEAGEGAGLSRPRPRGTVRDARECTHTHPPTHGHSRAHACAHVRTLAHMH